MSNFHKLCRDMTKPTRCLHAPAKTQTRPDGWPVCSESSLSAWRNLGSLATHWAHSEDWSEWADAQADISLRWAHSHFVGFVMSWLKLFVFQDEIRDDRPILPYHNRRTARKAFANCLWKLCKVVSIFYGSIEKWITWCHTVDNVDDFVEHAIGHPVESVEMKIVDR